VAEMYGEFVRVTGASGGTGGTGGGTLHDYNRMGDHHPRTGASDPTALIPRPFLGDFTIPDLTIGGVGSQVPSSQIKRCVGVTLENVQFELGDPAALPTGFGLANCRKVTIINCRMPYAAEFNAVQNAAFYGGEVADFFCGEFSRQIEFHGTRLSGDFTVF